MEIQVIFMKGLFEILKTTFSLHARISLAGLYPLYPLSFWSKADSKLFVGI